MLLIPKQIYYLRLPEADGSDNGDRNISGTITRTCGGGHGVQNSTSPPTRPSIAAISYPPPTTGPIPSEIPADVQSFHRARFNCFVVINAAKRRLGLNHAKPSQNSPKRCFQSLYLHKQKAFDG